MPAAVPDLDSRNTRPIRPALIAAAALLCACGVSEFEAELDDALEDEGVMEAAITLPSQNVLKNPSFEQDASGWTAWQAYVQRRSLSSAPHGSYVARVVRSSGTMYSIDDLPEAVPAAAAGAKYQATAYVRAGSKSARGKPIQLVVRERTSSGASVRTTSSPVTKLTTSFQSLRVDATVSGQGNILDVYVVQSSATSGDAFLVDAFTLVPMGNAPVDNGGEPTTPSADPTPAGQGGTWKLVFRDEFEGTALDTSKWVPCFPWGSSTGCSSRTTPEMYYLPKNVIVTNGLVRLRANRESITVDGTTYRYTSGMISSAGYGGLSTYRYLFKYGYMEMRARVPKGKGLWPAFWTLPPEGKWPPEIDVMEILGHQTNVQHMHFHYLDSGGVHRDSGGSYSGPDFASGFHTFAVEWSPGAIRWFVDGVERRTAFTDSRYIPAEPMYLIANLQVGGSWPGSPDSTTPFPAYYDIDYIRVWTR